METPTRRKRSLERAAQIALALAAALVVYSLAVAAVALLAHDWAAIRFPYPLDYGEGPILDQAVRLSRLESIYPTDLAIPPYNVSNYPPLYPLLQAPLVRLFGPALWYGRALSTVSLLSAALCCGLILHATTGDALAALSGGMLLIAFPYVVHWSSFVRVDSLALGLSCAGLYVLVRWGKGRAGLIGAAALLVAAVYTRQSYALAAPLAGFAWLLRRRPRRRALALAGWVALLGGVVLVALLALTRGGFYTHIVTANVNRFVWRTVRHYAEEMARHVPYLLASSGLYVLLGAWRRPRAWWVVAPYLVGGALSAATVGKVGSSVNYMFELSAALSLAAGALIAWAGRRRWLRALLLLCLALQVGAMVRWTEDRYLGRVMGKVARMDEVARMAEWVRQAEGPVLADEYMGLVPLAGKGLYYQPFEFKQLHEAGVWSQWPMVGQIGDQGFSLILLYDPPGWDSQGERWTPEMRAMIVMRYQETERLADTIVYRPRAR
ncbi:MAG: glycosyltransferase family 39 protein [Anaerolineae bacterium]|nr:glycosyltransferase family 39 protein [Anaerolineae bacterium]